MEKVPKVAIYLGRNAKAVSATIGLLFACLGVFLSLLGVMQAAVDSAEQKQAQLASMLSAVTRDTRELLIRLNKYESTACTHANLVRLRGIMHEYRYTRDIGIFDGEGRLYCTTDIGLLPKPIRESENGLSLPVDNPLWPTRELKLKQGPQYWPSVKLLDSPTPVRAMIVRFGRFNIVLDPFFRKDLLGNLHRGLWVMAGSGRVTPMLFPHSADFVNRMQPIVTRALLAGVSYRLFPLRIDIARKVPESNMLLFHYVRWRDALAFAPQLFLAGVVLSVVLGILIAMSLSPRLQRFQSLAYRIRHLCDDAHVRCMYQPIIRMADGSIAGAEVLLRVLDDGKILRPDEVLPHIVEQGLTWRVDKTVTAKAFKEIAHLYHKMNGLMVAFNFFPEDLRFETAGLHLNLLCEHYAVKPADITVEITEHQLATSALDEIRLFSKAGYRISVDDFGTGYSNLGSLKAVMPDHLKIDKSFVFDMEQQSMKSTLIPEIVAIARAVNAEVIAEGIERKEQLTMLRDLGVEFGQGYFIAKPMPIEEFIAFTRMYEAVPELGSLQTSGA